MAAVADKRWPRWPDPPAFADFAARGVRVARSTVPAAGRGVFAAVDLPARRLLGVYRGVKLSASEYDAAFASAERPPTYVLQVSPRVYVDAADPAARNWTALINDPRGTGATANVEFTAGGHIKTLRAIAAGEELLIDYGAAYWG